jgi:hypothetical protein
MQSRQFRFPVQAILVRLINPDRFDKTFRAAGLERVDQEPAVTRLQLATPNPRLAGSDPTANRIIAPAAATGSIWSAQPVLRSKLRAPRFGSSRTAKSPAGAAGLLDFRMS